MTERIQNMETAQYEKFTNARQTSFCSRKGKKSHTYAKGFLQWLDSPNIDNGIIYVLNFCAIEIVATVVGSAILCREEEPCNFFLNEYPTYSLQLRHYEEAVRRNNGYAKRKDILFGNF
ncbi:hypothetical protein DdX_07383 [Ditylenchus destructor]|uniref:Uncharacterized protein n=1 Tax=Ditylenchus destructor TaxID=166010 RepID=A0AAD4N7H6_9BILA|nr:hypothetical protein DdX_07383 [Ditylenchus destructor]